MATTFEFRVSCEEKLAGLADRTLAEAQRLMHRLEHELSEFLPETPVARLNRAEPLRPVEMPGSALELLERSERLRAQTEGAFNCAAKSRWELVAPSAARVAFRRDGARGFAWRLDDGARIGFGAIGKGYAIDRARELLERAGFTNYLLSAGGSSLAIAGYAGPGRPWRWGWSWERDAEGANRGLALSHPSGTPIAIGVSGTHEKGNHLIDPRRLGETPVNAASALVAHPSATDADALSTALYVAGWEKGLRLLQSSTASPAAAEIGEGGVPRWNGIFQRFWGSLAPALVALALLAPAARADDPAPAPSEAAPAADTSSPSSDEVDLSAMGMDAFTPYVTERNPYWIALPLFAITVVLVHLRKNRPFTKAKAVSNPRKEAS